MRLLDGTFWKLMHEVRKVLKPTTNANVLCTYYHLICIWRHYQDSQEIQYPAQKYTPDTVPQKVVINILQEVI